MNKKVRIAAHSTKQTNRELRIHYLTIMVLLIREIFEPATTMAAGFALWFLCVKWQSTL